MEVVLYSAADQQALNRIGRGIYLSYLQDIIYFDDENIIIQKAVCCKEFEQGFEPKVLGLSLFSRRSHHMVAPPLQILCVFNRNQCRHVLLIYFPYTSSRLYVPHYKTVFRKKFRFQLDTAVLCIFTSLILTP